MHLVLAIVLLVMAPATLSAQEKSKAAATRDRVNTLLDERLARMLRAHVTAECRAEAEKTYSAIRFNKRREFVDRMHQQSHRGRGAGEPSGAVARLRPPTSAAPALSSDSSYLTSPLCSPASSRLTIWSDQASILPGFQISCLRRDSVKQGRREEWRT